MLKGVRTAIKYFTLGLLAGVLMAPREGTETRKLLLQRGQEYFKELMSSGTHAAADLGKEAIHRVQETYKSEGRDYDHDSASVQ